MICGVTGQSCLLKGPVAKMYPIPPIHMPTSQHVAGRDDNNPYISLALYKDSMPRTDLYNKFLNDSESFNILFALHL